jgi:hypothetical protein
MLAPTLYADSWDTVRALHPGDRVKVWDKDGAEHRGAVATVTDTTIALAQISIERPRVKRVAVHARARRIRNIAIGAGVGLAIAVAVDQTLGHYLRNESNTTARPAIYLAPIGLCGAIAAAVSPYRTIYRVK